MAPHASQVWDVIATEGATSQMVDDNGYGLNWKGHYDPELIAHFGGARRRARSLRDREARPARRRWGLNTTHGRHYAMARNLAPKLARRLRRGPVHVDVLVMPTLPMCATPFPPQDAGINEVVARALEMLVNTAPSTSGATPPARCRPGSGTACRSG